MNKYFNSDSEFEIEPNVNEVFKLADNIYKILKDYGYNKKVCHPSADFPYKSIHVQYDGWYNGVKLLLRDNGNHIYGDDDIYISLIDNKGTMTGWILKISGEKFYLNPFGMKDPKMEPKITSIFREKFNGLKFGDEETTKKVKNEILEFLKPLQQFMLKSYENKKNKPFKIVFVKNKKELVNEIN